jgi:hypothetical protein
MNCAELLAPVSLQRQFETRAAARMLGGALERFGAAEVHRLLDRAPDGA